MERKREIYIRLFCSLSCFWRASCCLLIQVPGRVEYLQTYLVVIRSRSGDWSGLVFVAVRLSCLSIIRYSTQVSRFIHLLYGVFFFDSNPEMEQHCYSLSGGLKTLCAFFYYYAYCLYSVSLVIGDDRFWEGSGCRWLVDFYGGLVGFLSIVGSLSCSGSLRIIRIPISFVLQWLNCGRGFLALSHHLIPVREIYWRGILVRCVSILQALTSNGYDISVRSEYILVALTDCRKVCWADMSGCVRKL